MNQPDSLLKLLEPPPGGWERLRARRSAATDWGPSWWALASGGAAAIAWLAVASGHTKIQMHFSGARLIGERSHGVGVQLLENGRTVFVPSADANVRIYLVEPSGSTEARN
jgi:hypothetical protein